jgi:prefoldin subunit 5
MKLRNAIGIFLIIFLLGVYWYRSNASVCPVPLSYQLGELDQEFSLSESEALAYVSRAEAIWEEATKRELFTQVDAKADITVNFIFDERQERADAESLERQELDALQAENDKLFAQIDEFRTEYEDLTSRYESKTRTYEKNLAAYNQKVRQYNDRGGAPEDVFVGLQAEARQLQAEVDGLNVLAQKIDGLANSINELVARANSEAEAYNRQVEQYNETYGYRHEFTQGNYRTGEINIYKFSNEDELVAVLAHEFGHALGIDHVEGEDSLMYYLLEDPVAQQQLSSGDLAAYTMVCGEEESTAQALRRTIREFLAIFR